MWKSSPFQASALMKKQLPDRVSILQSRLGSVYRE
jgi:hypothetical protein